MFEATDLLIAAGVTGFSLAALVLLWRGPPRPIAIDEALVRLHAGERGVRVPVEGSVRETRLLTRFNAMIAEIEAGNFDWTHASKHEALMFEALRGEVPSTDQDMYVAVIEIDRLAALRQNLGYRAANAIMAKLADRIASLIEDAEIGRVGRTTIEFAFRGGTFGAAHAKLLSAVEGLERRMTIDGFTLDLSVVIGFAHAGSSSIRDELVDHAAAALAVGRAERFKVCFADESVISAQGMADVDLMRMLPGALQNGEISLHYQPKLDARSNSFPSVEALLRWQHPSRGLIQTDQLIKLAEETGAIRDITEWALARAVSDQSSLATRGHDLDVYVNISGLLLPDDHFAKTALALTKTAGCRIGFEITETAVIGDPDAALTNLHAFVDAGIKIAIDDYGSGLSSLAYLKQLPAHELKIDRMFVSGLIDSNRDPLLVRSSIDLAHALEMVVTAEGVDDPMALCLLRVMGCDLLQGYYISQPLPIDALISFLNDPAQCERLSMPTFDAVPVVAARNA